jgi:osmotically-inducible protein OsmY
MVTNTQAIQDEAIQRDVLEEFHVDHAVKPNDIGVGVHEGIVTLTGTVESYHEKWAAGHAALRVYGVRGIANDLQVRPSKSATDASDTDIALMAKHLLDWNVAVPQRSVQIEVSRGHVVLAGTVRRPYQRAAAERPIRRINGVRSMTNLIKVEPQTYHDASAGEIKKRIGRALMRSAQLDGEWIDVQVDGPTVRLNGTVHSWTELQEAVRAAWSAPGVLDVEDNLLVAP